MAVIDDDENGFKYTHSALCVGGLFATTKDPLLAVGGTYIAGAMDVGNIRSELESLGIPFTFGEKVVEEVIPPETGLSPENVNSASEAIAYYLQEGPVAGRFTATHSATSPSVVLNAAQSGDMYQITMLVKHPLYSVFYDINIAECSVLVHDLKLSYNIVGDLAGATPLATFYSGVTNWLAGKAPAVASLVDFIRKSATTSDFVSASAVTFVAFNSIDVVTKTGWLTRYWPEADAGTDPGTPPDPVEPPPGDSPEDGVIDAATAVEYYLGLGAGITTYDALGSLRLELNEPTGSHSDTRSAGMAVKHPELVTWYAITFDQLGKLVNHGQDVFVISDAGRTLAHHEANELSEAEYGVSLIDMIKNEWASQERILRTNTSIPFSVFFDVAALAAGDLPITRSGYSSGASPTGMSWVWFDSSDVSGERVEYPADCMYKVWHDAYFSAKIVAGQYDVYADALAQPALSKTEVMQRLWKGQELYIFDHYLFKARLSLHDDMDLFANSATTRQNWNSVSTEMVGTDVSRWVWSNMDNCVRK